MIDVLVKWYGEEKLEEGFEDEWIDGINGMFDIVI